MISDWRGERRIVGAPGPLDEASHSAGFALKFVGWTVATAGAVVLIGYLFGEVSTLRFAVCLWAYTFLFLGELWVVLHLLMNRLWISAAIAAVLIAALAFTVLHWAGPVLAAFGWSDAAIPVTS